MDFLKAKFRTISFSILLIQSWLSKKVQVNEKLGFVVVKFNQSFPNNQFEFDKKWICSFPDFKNFDEKLFEKLSRKKVQCTWKLHLMSGYNPNG